MDRGEVPHVDKHSVAISASPGVVWAALIRTVGNAFSGDRVELAWLRQLAEAAEPSRVAESAERAAGAEPEIPRGDLEG